jgi:hypothetical protein
MQEQGINEWGDSVVMYDPTFNIFHDINVSPIPRGGVAKLRDFKMNLLRISQNKLAELTARIKKERGNEAEYAKLVKEANDLREYIDGDEISGVEGLKDEILKIDAIDSRSPELIEPYIRKELDRLESLVNSNDPKDTNEAKQIIDFIISMGDFSNPAQIEQDGHKIYDYDELFDDQRNFLLQDVMVEPFRQWKGEAEEYKRKLESKNINILESEVNKLSQVQKGYGKLSFKQLTENLKDTNWIDMMIMDIGSGILSHNGLLPQAVKTIVNNTFEKHRSWSKGIIERIDELLPAVEKRLNQLGYGFGIPGMKGVKYSIFRQEYKDGNKTRELVHKYSPEYQDAKNKTIDKFWQMKNNAETAQGMNRLIGINHAYKMRNAWINKNNIMVNPALLAELKNDPDFADFNFSTNQQDIDEHTKKIKDLVGDVHYEEIIKTQKKLLQEYKVQRNNKIAELTEKENKNIGEDLSEAGKTKLKIWEALYSPFTAVPSVEQNAPLQVGDKTYYPNDLRLVVIYH